MSLDKPSFLDVTIDVSKCNIDQNPDDPVSAKDLLLAGRIRLRLVSPQIQSGITPITDEIQSLKVGQPATWSWSIAPAAPGEYELSLALSILPSNKDSTADPINSPRISLSLNVSGNPIYYAQDLGLKAQGLLVALAGSLTALGTTALAAVTLVPRIRRARAEGKKKDTASPGGGSSSGYL